MSFDFKITEEVEAGAGLIYNVLMLEKYLEEIGLSEKEAKIYLLLLQFENASIKDLAKKTPINRTTIYPVLESLATKGLVSEVQIGKKIHYEAASPERLQTYIERQKVLLDEKASRLKDIIPQIKGVEREKGERPIVKFFDGRDGAISAYTEFYDFPKEQEKEGYFILNADLLHDVFTGDEIKQFREIRKGKNIYSLVVYNKKEGDNQFEGSKGATRIDSEKYPITSDIAVIDDQIIISTLGKRVTSLFIKSKDIADTLKSLVQYVIDTKK